MGRVKHQPITESCRLRAHGPSSPALGPAGASLRTPVVRGPAAGAFVRPPTPGAASQRQPPQHGTQERRGETRAHAFAEHFTRETEMLHPTHLPHMVENDWVNGTESRSLRWAGELEWNPVQKPGGRLMTGGRGAPANGIRGARRLLLVHSATPVSVTTKRLRRSVKPEHNWG